MRQLLFILIILCSISCSESSQFAGTWICSNKSNCSIILQKVGGDNLKITTIRSNGSHFSMIGTVNNSGAFVANGWKFYIDQTTGTLNAPSGGDWDKCCKTFSKPK